MDREQRTLTRSGKPVELNARYFDALAMMVEQPGQLLVKDRFMDEVWSGVPVTDEALTQCIRSLRKVLGDDAARPRFIETVPKHGYRFIADVQGQAGTASGGSGSWPKIAALAGAGAIGGGLAGLAGGTLYGVAAASDAAVQDIGGVSILLVLTCVTIAVAVIGAAGVSFGLAIAGSRAKTLPRLVLGGAVGGLVVGLLAKLVMIDAFRILFGQSPGDITGAVEGAMLGASVGLAAWAASRAQSLRRAAGLAAFCGAGGGLLVALVERPLMAGSLARLAEHLPNSRLNLDAIASLVGEDSFGPVTTAATATLEGALFAAAIILAMRVAERQQQGLAA